MPPDTADNDGGQSSHDWQEDAPSPSASIKSDNELDEDGNERPGATSQPIQKRRRVTRACDECRRKKIKRRNPAPQYIEALESRLQRAESLLHKFMPDVDLADPNLDPAIQQEFRNRENARSQAPKMRQPPPPSQPDPNDAHLTSMIDSVGQLDLDEKGSWDFHGISSGAVFLKRMKEHFRGMLGPASKAPFLPRAERPVGLDSPSLSSVGTPFSAVASYPELPPKDVTRKLCYYSLSCATCLVRIVHVPTFYEQMDKIYERPLDNLTKEETQYLGLLFSVMALGCMYNNLDDNDPGSMAYQDATEEGLKYYNAARSVIHDMTDCRDLISLQALLFIILFLQATSNLSSCYSFVGIALRSSLRIGLHRHLQHEKIDPIEQEVRKRVFYVVRQMDIYVSTLLGFPLLLNVDDIDQPFPLEVDDEFITHAGILRPPPGSPSFFQAFNAHSELMEILSKVTKYVYPTKGLGQGLTKDNKPASTYLISYGRIKEIEAELHSWFERLPQHWRPSGEGPIETVRQGTKVDELSYACAAAAISVSRNIVHIGLEIRKQRVLSGPYWFMLYTEFFAVLSLVFYATENPEKPGSGEVLADARAGRQMIAALAEKSMSAERVTGALKVLFDQLPEQLDAGSMRQAPSKKRSAPTAGGRPSSVSSHHTPIPSSMSSIGTTDFTRASQISTSSYPTTLSQGTIDMPGGGMPAFQDNSFSANFGEFMTPEMQRSTPESTSSAATSAQRVPYTGQQLGVHNPVNKLDSLMFPSEDPFAYPNQPMMELGYPGKTDQPANMGDQSQDMQLFLTGTFDDVESQIFGQPPPYMMHQQGQPMMGAPSQPMYHSPSNMMGMQPGQSMMHQRRPVSQTHAIHQGHSMSNRRAHTQRHQERQIQQMFTEQGMQADWGGFFGSGRGGFQGM
ncbi:Gypsy retrotransposon integrase-like protein 1 [Fusarium torreyae]|uniref:Gypsy retrotransposon integrase-like protein 1 n=1 Tax=Fusarium torreyae TaxID=1237075 RepID=A0A9W8VGU3_9HYPO|nr:Gypsy retrotransposon integrase-like protein 1 [Fusarium torreyae]